jgi:hypothetical protein
MYNLKAMETSPQNIDISFGATSHFAVDSWATIASYSEAGTALTRYKVGDEKIIPIDGVNYTFVILGFNHDDLVGGGKAGITIGMKNLMNYTAKMNSTNTNVGSFHGSEMRNTTLATIRTQMPTDLQAYIKTVVKKTTAGGGTGTTPVYAIENSEETLFLFSRMEILNQTIAGYKDEGSTYEYYTSVVDGTTDAGRTKGKESSQATGSNWWLRSPHYARDTLFSVAESP